MQQRITPLLQEGGASSLLMKTQTNWSSRVGRPRYATQDMQTGIFLSSIFRQKTRSRRGGSGGGEEKGRRGEGERRGRLNPSCRITL